MNIYRKTLEILKKQGNCTWAYRDSKNRLCLASAILVAEGYPISKVPTQDERTTYFDRCLQQSPGIKKFQELLNIPASVEHWNNYTPRRDRFASLEIAASYCD